MISFYDVDGRMGLKNVWDLLDWGKHIQIVSRIQARIVKAVKNGLKQTARGLQRLLSNSLAAKLIAIKRVISNSGKRTPSVDNILIDTPRKRWETLKNLNLPEYKAKPLKRIYIPKKNGKKRPLGIPAMHDRVEQALDLLGLDPVSESTADNHSYGFRKVRSAQDAMGAIYNALRRKGSADWILEADIKGCFDHIGHKWLDKNIPMNKKKLQQWLKCGYLEKRTFNPTNEGTPQGGIISPTLANMDYRSNEYAHLSPMCYCSGVAPAAAASGVAYLHGATREQISDIIRTSLGNLAGVICDGAKPSCAFRSYTGLNGALQAMLMAEKGLSSSSIEGVVHDTVDGTIENIYQLQKQCMSATDEFVFKVKKKQGTLC